MINFLLVIVITDQKIYNNGLFCGLAARANELKYGLAARAQKLCLIQKLEVDV